MVTTTQERPARTRKPTPKKTERLALSASRTDLVAALGSAVKATAGGGANVRLHTHGDTLTVQGASLDASLTDSVEVNVTGEGVAVVPAVLVDQVVRAVEDDVSLAVEGTNLIIHSGEFHATIPVLSSDEYSVITQPAGAKTVTVNASELLEIVGRVEVAIAADQARPMLTGMLFAPKGKTTDLVATDSYRLALAEAAWSLPAAGPVVVPRPAISLLHRAVNLAADDDVEIAVSDEVITFETTHSLVSARLIQGEFPKYDQLLPASAELAGTATVSRARLAGICRRACLLTDAAVIDMDFTTDALKVGSHGLLGTSEEAMPATLVGMDSLECAFNAIYLGEALAAADTDEVCIGLQNEFKPALITMPGPAGSHNAWRYLLMPVRRAAKVV